MFQYVVLSKINFVSQRTKVNGQKISTYSSNHKIYFYLSVLSVWKALCCLLSMAAIILHLISYFLLQLHLSNNKDMNEQVLHSF